MGPGGTKSGGEGQRRVRGKSTATPVGTNRRGRPSVESGQACVHKVREHGVNLKPEGGWVESHNNKGNVTRHCRQGGGEWSIVDNASRVTVQGRTTAGPTNMKGG